jgi:hypothetical protein
MYSKGQKEGKKEAGILPQRRSVTGVACSLCVGDGVKMFSLGAL